MATLSPASPSADAGVPSPRKSGNGAAQVRPAPEALLSPDSSLLRDVPVTLEARLGEVAMPISELLDLHAGAVLNLETRLSDPVELYLNGAIVARGEIVAVDDRFGVRIVEIAAK